MNVTFQSISKWEQGIHYPDIFMLEQIAKHYNVKIDYFFKSNNPNEEKKTDIFILKTCINHNDMVVTWTDFEYQGTIAPSSFLDKTRHRAGNGVIMTHPGPKGYLIIAVDAQNKICCMANHCDNHFPICGPHGKFYSQLNGIGKNNPCLIIMDTYDIRVYERSKDFEFVIPKNGFLINIPLYSIEAKELLMFLVSKNLRKNIQRNFPNIYPGKSLFEGGLLAGELDSIAVYLKDNQLIFEKPIIEEKEAQNNDSTIEELTSFVNELENRIYALESRIKELEDQDLESSIDDLEARIYDIEDRLSD